MSVEISTLLVLAVSLTQAPLHLEEAVELAVSRNERAFIAAQQRQKAEAQLEQARAFFFPSLDATGAYTRRPSEVVRNVGGNTLVVQSANALNATANLRWTLFDARGIPLLQSAHDAHKASIQDEKEARRRLGFDAAWAYLATLAAEQVQEAALRRRDLAQKSLEEASARLEARLVSQNDVTRAKLELASALREVTRATGEVKLSYAQLGFLLNSPTPQALTTPQTLFDEAVSAKPFPKAQVNAQAFRLDLKSSRTRAEAAEKAAFEPSLRILPALSLRGTTRVTNEPGIVGRIIDGSLGADLTWTLFDQGLRFGEAREKRAQAQILRLSANTLSRAIDVEVQSAEVEWQSAQSALLEAQEAVQAAQSNASETQALYSEGLSTALEVADASLRLFEAEVAFVSEKVGVAVAFLRLRQAQGLDVFGNAVSP